MKPARRIITALMACLIALTCHAEIILDQDVNRDGNVDVQDLTTIINLLLKGSNSSNGDVNHDGVIDVRDITCTLNAIITGKHSTYRTEYDYVWDYNDLPEVHIEVSVDQWNQLLAYFDENFFTKEYVMAKITFMSQNGTTTVDSVGLKIRGNYSRHRPEGKTGEPHVRNTKSWHPTGFGVNLRKYCDDDDHTLRGIRKVLLRYFYNDPSYVRELYCYRLYEKYGVWTSLRDSYCRLWIHVEGDDKEAYFGVYTLLEPVDKRYLKDREEQFGSSKGYLWKASLALADLRKTYDALFGTDDDPEESAYALKTRTEEFTKAKQQLINFIDSLNTPSTIQFQHWIERVCDVNLLLKTYAVMVTVGNWDDYWNNANNYYIYFNSTHPTQYKMFFIPFDLDNTLGSSREVEAIVDTGRQNPLKWGQDDLNPLIARIIAIPKYRQYYIGCLKELIDPNNHLFDYQTSVDLIKQWQNFVKPYVPSDVDRDDVLADRPNPMGNMPQYRLLSTSAETNFFKVRTAAINQHINNYTP